MCGIVGLFSPVAQDAGEILALAATMQAAHHFRGPDGQGVWGNAHVALGNVRLAIHGDLKLGLQPLQDRWGGHLVFNGEVFEPREILSSLGEPYHPEDSDGVALEAVLARKGPAGLAHMRGMFAVARYDTNDGSLVLARDTWGQKPLYLMRWRAGWAFASTIAALQAIAGKLTLRREAPIEYLLYKSVGGLHTSFVGIEQVPPGSWMRFLPDGSVQAGRYTDPPPRTDGAATPDDVRRQIDAAVAARATGDFVNALLLSGGADSAIVAASLVRQRPDLGKMAFSVGYDVSGPEDETGYAARMARHLGVEHEVVRLEAAALPGLFEETARFTEDPIADPVTLPTLLLSRRISEVSKVALSGDGSDEFWGGYARFDHAPDTLSAYLPRSMVFHPEELGLDAPPSSYLDGIADPPMDLSPLDRILRLESSNRLRNYHLARIDKLGMASALEIRSPFVDARVTELAHSLPADVKRPDGRAKGLLLDAFTDDLPDWLVHRKKQPFSMPLVAWLSGRLRAYAWDVLTAPGAWVRSFVEPRAHLERFAAEPELETAARLWSLLQLEAWHEVWKGRLT